MSTSKNYLVSDFIADWLEKHQISIVFGIIGSANSYIFDSILRKGFTKVIFMHHEQSAVMAAGAYYRASGKISVAIVTAGAGSANAITGVVCNWADSIPCIVLSGQESTKYLIEHSDLRMYGTQGFDIINSVKKITKQATLLTDPNKISYTLDESLHVAMSDRPGPTWIDIPMDIQSSNIDIESLSSFVNTETANYSQEINFDQISKMIESSERPVILAGHGIRLSKSIESFHELMNNLKIPVVHSWSSIDIVSSDDDFNYGCPGIYGQRAANFIIQNCDLLIVIGSRLALPQTGYNINNFAPNAKIIMVNNDELELNKYSRYDMKIYCDCKYFIDRMNEKIFDSYKENWVIKCNGYREDFPLVEECHLEDNKNFDNSYVLINEISKKLEDNHIIVIGQGSPLPCCHQALIHSSNQTIFASNGLGEMGNGLPSAIGAALSDISRPIILFDGDGSSMMNIQEFQTVIGYKIPLKIVIFNNSGYLFIKHTQKMLFEGRYTGVDSETGMSLPNFEKVSTAFGFEYFNTKKNNFDEFLNFSGPAVLECFMNPEQDLVPKVKGIMTNGSLLAPPLEEMSPLLPIEVLEKSMVEVNKLSYEIRL